MSDVRCAEPFSYPPNNIHDLSPIRKKFVQMKSVVRRLISARRAEALRTDQRTDQPTDGPTNRRTDSPVYRIVAHDQKLPITTQRPSITLHLPIAETAHFRDLKFCRDYSFRAIMTISHPPPLGRDRCVGGEGWVWKRLCTFPLRRHPVHEINRSPAHLCQPYRSVAHN